MSIRVVAKDSVKVDPRTYASVKTWMINGGALVLIDEKGNRIAAFGPGAWDYVEEVQK